MNEITKQSWEKERKNWEGAFDVERFGPRPKSKEAIRYQRQHTSPTDGQIQLMHIHHVSNAAIAQMEKSGMTAQDWSQLIDDLMTGVRHACPVNDPITGLPCRHPTFNKGCCNSCAQLSHL